MPLNMTYSIVGMLIVLFVLILIGGVFKDFLFEFGPFMGLQLISVKDTNVETPDIQITAVEHVSADSNGNPLVLYDYTVRLTEAAATVLNTEKSKVEDKMANVALFFKGRAATSDQEQVKISGGWNLTFRILNALEKPNSLKTPSIDKEFFVLSFYEPNRDCYQLGMGIDVPAESGTIRISPTQKKFISECAANFISSTSFSVDKIIYPETGSPATFSCAFYADNEANCLNEKACRFDYQTEECESCPEVTSCSDPKIRYATWCKCGLNYGLNCYWSSFQRGCFDCNPSAISGTRCSDLSEVDCKVNACGLNCGWDGNQCRDCSYFICEDLQQGSCQKICGRDCYWNSDVQLCCDSSSDCG
jgi:hypothetical protein